MGSNTRAEIGEKEFARGPLPSESALNQGACCNGRLDYMRNRWILGAALAALLLFVAGVLVFALERRDTQAIEGDGWRLVASGITGPDGFVQAELTTDKDDFERLWATSSAQPVPLVDFDTEVIVWIHTSSNITKSGCYVTFEGFDRTGNTISPIMESHKPFRQNACPSIGFFSSYAGSAAQVGDRFV